MSYRYNTTDIVVGVGMCAILFGGLLFFLAASGTYQRVLPQVIASEQSTGLDQGIRLLQPAIGQAIIDQALLERQTNLTIAQSVSEWNRATLAYHEWQSGSRGLLGAVLNQAIAVPANHLARVQGVMGRAIVNFTNRGVRNGLLSVDRDGTLYNMRMIGAIEAQGQRLHDAFASTWQATIGRRIVEAAQHDWLQTGTLQERLGWALVQAQMSTAAGQAVQQEQLASLIVAAVRSEIATDPTMLPTVLARPEHIADTSAEQATWPEMPMGYLLIAGLMLSVVFLGGLTLAAHSREAKAYAQMKRDADRWVYRMAA